MSKLVDAIVRGPLPYFGKDGVLHIPGSIVQDVPAEEVSEEDSREITVQVRAEDGRRYDEQAMKPYVFRPLGKNESVVAEPADTSQVATGNPDRLNVSDFLKQGPDQVAAAIASGSVDDHLGAIEQAEIARRGPARANVKAAITARLAAIRR